MKVPVPASTSQSQRAFVRPGFRWDSGDAYLFDIDGTLLNSRDAVHYYAFRTAMLHVAGLDATIDNVPVHGNTDMGILRAVMRRHGLADSEIDAHMPRFIDRMCAEVERNREQLRPEVCSSVLDVLSWLQRAGKLLGVASGNLERVGWLKLEQAGLKHMFSFGAFSYPRELRSEIFMHGIEQARRRLGGSATVFVVGDTPSDIEASRAVGVPVIALATGIFDFETLQACGPDACFACGADLLEFTGI